MLRLRIGVGVLLIVLLCSSGQAAAADKPVAVATFSILADLTRRIGGDHVEVIALVGPNEDAHVFEPGPKESAELGRARLLVANGLAFEPWLDRLTTASGFKGALVVATDGATLLFESDQGTADPHAFQDLANARIYAVNIARGLAEADPAHAADFNDNLDALIAEMAALNNELTSDFAAIAAERRRVLTSHDAFRYFGEAYGIEFIAVQGVSTEAEPSAADLGKIVRQAREGRVAAIFLENMADPRLAETVARESGVRMGGELYADALSGPDGPAPDYLSLIRHNAEQLLAAMR